MLSLRLRLDRARRLQSIILIDAVFAQRGEAIFRSPPVRQLPEKLPLFGLRKGQPLSTLYLPGPMNNKLKSKIDISKAGSRV